MDVDQSALTGGLEPCTLEPKNNPESVPGTTQVSEGSVDVDQSALTGGLEPCTLEP